MANTELDTPPKFGGRVMKFIRSRDGWTMILAFAICVVSSIFMAGLLPVGGGELHIGGRKMEQLGDTERRMMRISTVGQVFQELELVEYLTVRENILLPYFINRQFQLTAEAERRAAELAQQARIDSHLDRPVGRLSHGERPRVAACRAMVVEPGLILADEPTANVDSDTAKHLLDLMQELNESHAATFIFSTHDQRVMERAKRVIRMVDGQIESDQLQ